MADSKRPALFDLVLWGLSAGSAGLTAWLSLWSVPPGTNAFPHVDKLQHFVAYLVTSSFLYRAGVWRAGRGRGPLADRAILLASLLVGGAGVLELLQVMLDREAELADWIAGALGVAVAFGLGEAARRRRSRLPDFR